MKILHYYGFHNVETPAMLQIMVAKMKSPGNIRIMDADQVDRRIDNFLLTRLKGLPRCRLYTLLRKGNIRVNKRRVRPDYRLCLADVISLPPLHLRDGHTKKLLPERVYWLEKCVLYEDTDILILNKPSGMPVHGGSGIHCGVINAMRVLRPQIAFLELAHRLDRDTSGCLLLAKKRSVLQRLHRLFAERSVDKRYIALLQGTWEQRPSSCRVEAPLLKYQLHSGQRFVRVDPKGKPAQTEFSLRKQYHEAALVEARLLTGRTHQIRVHAQHISHPLAGDEKYGDTDFNKSMKQCGLGRLFLHASSLDFTMPETGRVISVRAPLPEVLDRLLQALA